MTNRGGVLWCDRPMSAEFPVVSQNLRYLWLEYYESIIGLVFDEGFWVFFLGGDCFS